MNKQERLYRALRKVKPTTIWGVAIQDHCKQPNPDMEQLTRQLKSQMKDSPRIMRNILGTRTFIKLLTW